MKMTISRKKFEEKAEKWNKMMSRDINPKAEGLDGYPDNILDAFTVSLDGGVEADVCVCLDGSRVRCYVVWYDNCNRFLGRTGKRSRLDGKWTTAKMSRMRCGFTL